MFISSLDHLDISVKVTQLGSYLNDLSPGDTDEKIIRLEGLEPPTFGSVDRHLRNTSSEKTNAYAKSKQKLTPQLTPESQKESEIDAGKLPDDLAAIIKAWPELPEAIRSAIVAIVRASNDQHKG